jgi:hypothetical protein
MTDSDAKLIVLLENVLADIMSDLDNKISSHSAMILSNESRFLSEKIKRLRRRKMLEYDDDERPSLRYRWYQQDLKRYPDCRDPDHPGCPSCEPEEE